MPWSAAVMRAGKTLPGERFDAVFDPQVWRFGFSCVWCHSKDVARIHDAQVGQTWYRCCECGRCWYLREIVCR